MHMQGTVCMNSSRGQCAHVRLEHLGTYAHMYDFM